MRAELLFETARLRVREIERADADAMYAVYGDADAMRWVDDGQPIDRAECERWIEITLRNYATRGYGMSVLVERASGEVIGFCGLVHPGGQAEAEIKYALRRAWWGRGFATEAVTGMLRYGASEMGLTHVISTVADEHTVSQRVLAKAGLRLVETRPEGDGSATQVLEWRADPAAQDQRG